MSVEQDFRSAMRHVAAPVSVVTTQVGDVPVGTTVSAFDSLSMDPPMMTVALQVGSRLLSHLTIGLPLGINVLTHEQEALALRFAARDDRRFDGLTWRLTDGAPELADIHAWIGLRVREMVRGGDHVVVVGDVISARQGDGRPLTYHDRTFGTHHRDVR